MPDGIGHRRADAARSGEAWDGYGVVLALRALRIALRSDDVSTRLAAAQAILTLDKAGESAHVEIGAGVITIAVPARGRGDEDEARRGYERAGSPEPDATGSVAAG